jgi:hypothetical protein
LPAQPSSLTDGRHAQKATAERRGGRNQAA